MNAGLLLWVQQLSLFFDNGQNSTSARQPLVPYASESSYHSVSKCEDAGQRCTLLNNVVREQNPALYDDKFSQLSPSMLNGSCQWRADQLTVFNDGVLYVGEDFRTYYRRSLQDSATVENGRLWVRHVSDSESDTELHHLAEHCQGKPLQEADVAFVFGNVDRGDFPGLLAYTPYCINFFHCYCDLVLQQAAVKLCGNVFTDFRDSKLTAVAHVAKHSAAVLSLRALGISVLDAAQKPCARVKRLIHLPQMNWFCYHGPYTVSPFTSDNLRTINVWHEVRDLLLTAYNIPPLATKPFGPGLRNAVVTVADRRNAPFEKARVLVVQRDSRNLHVLGTEQAMESLWNLDSFDVRFTSFDHMPLRQQILHWQWADLVVTPHGAAFALVPFMRPGSAIIEVFGANVLSWEIQNLETYSNMFGIAHSARYSQPIFTWMESGKRFSAKEAADASAAIKGQQTDLWKMKESAVGAYELNIWMRRAFSSYWAGATAAIRYHRTLDIVE